MDATEVHESTSTNGWKTVTDLFEHVFGPDSDLSRSANTLDKDDTSTSETETSLTSYTTLNADVQGRRLNIRPQSNNLTYNHTLEEFLQPNLDSVQETYSISDLNRGNVTLVLDRRY